MIDSKLTPRSSIDLTRYLDRLQLKRLGDTSEAGLCITSLPWPRSKTAPLALDGRATFSQALGQWPGEPAGSPRRLLLVADGNNDAPATLSLAKAVDAAPASEPPSASMELIASSPDPDWMWERHALRLEYGGRSISLVMGLRTAGEVHWWEACRLVVIEETPQCTVIEMAGAIPHRIMPYEELSNYPGLSNPLLHKHNWLNGSIYARLHANGVCEIYAHHINSKYVDDGLPLHDAVPVIGFRSGDGDSQVDSLLGDWDGSSEGFELGGVRFDVAEVARLATPRQPGRIDRDGKFIVWQPYHGMELFGGLCPKQLIDDEFIFHAEQKIVPRGMARTLRFSLSLCDRSPRVVRYLAPAWWYGACEEFIPAPLLPIVNEDDYYYEAAGKWLLDSIVERGFEDGSVPRGTKNTGKPGGVQGTRHEPGWEGEIPYGQFLLAWRTGDERDYAAAMRSAYHFTDVCVDHAAKAVRMHGYPPNAFAIPMNRMLGPIAAYLDTGDPYLLNAAQAVTANSYWTHRNSWPRLAVGRDGCFVRSAMLLYRYFATDFYREIAHEGALAVAESQMPNGAFGDQGGGTGVHQWSGYIVKPWMGLLGTNGVLDYLEFFPDEERLAACVKGFADWLMAERFEINGVNAWTYQHDYNGTREFRSPFGTAPAMKLPTSRQWHMESIGRLLGYCALRFDNLAYFDAWAESHSTCNDPGGDHGSSALLQFLPWVQAHLWNATLEDDGIAIRPVHFGDRTPAEASIMTPNGKVEVRWSDGPQLEVPAGVEVLDITGVDTPALVTV